MFTGLIEQKDTVLKVDSTMDDTELTINNNGFEDLKEGDSVAVNGVCLTAYEITERSFKVTMINETKRITSLKDVKDGAEVNLERALKLSDRLGGHLVSGHVDATGTITEISHDGNAVIMKVKCPSRLMKYMADKGSVTIDGISLTLFEVDHGEETITLNLIPETLERTNLGQRGLHETVNIEADQIIKHIEHLLQHGGLDITKLSKAGGLGV
ncbi:MAG TPA: riboflavin synthase [Candidatus Salinicoccus merdavium]|nr:riboflavin synthase [Candidatus Salinicoccus merdavium]